MEFTDVWTFMSVRPFKGKHPAEKPQDMLMHMISASSFPGDIVLDCFAGSGSTGVAALRLKRRVVCIDIEEEWVERAASEMAAVTHEGMTAPLLPRSPTRLGASTDKDL
jgi:site-specific DNA-methyltransferase (adenine-specific)